MNDLHSTAVRQFRQRPGQRAGLWLLAAVFRLLTCSAASGASSWVEHQQVGPFRLYAEFPLRETGTLLNDLQGLPDQLRQALQLPPSEEVVEVFLFGNRNSYERYIASSLPDAPRQRRAFFVRSSGSSRVFAYRSRHLATDVRHECTHALLHAALPMVPLWLDEGLATYFEVAPDARVRGNPALRAAIWDARLDRMGSLSNLEKASSVGSFSAEDYRAAWAWVHFMLHGPPEAHEELIAFLADIRALQPPGSLHARLRHRLPDLDFQIREHFRRL